MWELYPFTTDFYDKHNVSESLIHVLQLNFLISLSSFFIAGIFHSNRIYEGAPWSMEAWSRPVENSPLASTRLAGTANNTTVNSNTVSSFFLN